MNSKERRQLENALLACGLANLSDPELIQQLADLVSDWRGDKHEFLRDLLNECDADKRYEMYTAIAPKLRFRALSLGQYESQIALRAGEMVSRRQMRVEGEAPRPIEVGQKKYIQTPKEFATNAVATLTCHKCRKVQKFVSDSPAGAMIKGRKAGWVRDPEVLKECCPDCIEVPAHAVE